MSDREDILLRAEGLKKFFPVRGGFFQRVKGYVKAVDGVDLEIRSGRTLGLVGESGCGKSTVARLLLRLLEPDSGRVFYKGREITAASEREMRSLRTEMQIIFQDPFGSLNPRMTVGAMLEEGISRLGVERKRRRERIEGLLYLVGLPDEAAYCYPHEFSGGQRQRIGIARALSVEPSILVCDEPISALDVSIQAQILNLLGELQKKLGLSYLFISHDLNVVGYFCDYTAVMYLGQVMEYAPTVELFEEPLHPYTKALIASIPSRTPGRGIPSPLEGDVPSPLDPPPGCRFQGRCTIAEERCRREEISLYPAGSGRLVRCWKAVI
jgi:oligopeptide/dipeptide ABC transporter ATP-binding protein